MSSADAAAEYWASLASAMKESLNAEASGIWHTLRRFAAVVDWTEPFVLAIVAAVTAIAAFAVLTRRRCDIQAALLVLIGCRAVCASHRNAVLMFGTCRCRCLGVQAPECIRQQDLVNVRHPAVFRRVGTVPCANGWGTASPGCNVHRGTSALLANARIPSVLSSQRRSAGQRPLPSVPAVNQSETRGAQGGTRTEEGRLSHYTHPRPGRLLVCLSRMKTTRRSNWIIEGEAGATPG